MEPNQVEDEYHTRCRICDLVKENFLFSPGNLRDKKRCRKCSSEIGKESKRKAGSDPSRHWRYRPQTITSDEFKP